MVLCLEERMAWTGSLYAQPDGEEEFGKGAAGLGLVAGADAEEDGVGEAEEVGVGGEFDAAGGVMGAGLAGAVDAMVVKGAGVYLLEIEHRSDVPVGEEEGKVVGAAEGGDLVAVERDAAGVGYFVAVGAGFAGNMLEAAVEGDGVIHQDAGEVELGGGPPLAAEVKPAAEGVGVAGGKALPPAGIDFLGGEAGLVVVGDAVFHELVVALGMRYGEFAGDDGQELRQGVGAEDGVSVADVCGVDAFHFVAEVRRQGTVVLFGGEVEGELEGEVCGGAAGFAGKV